LRKEVFTFELGPQRNRAVLAALGPEASRDVPRAAASVSAEGPRLRLEITAEDSASLRAAVNSYLRWVKLAAGAAEAGAAASGGKKDQRRITDMGKMTGAPQKRVKGK
jgi:KEOPS complex subunit Pcc1